jgi:predicted RNase H-like HicB family nuclease
MNWWKIIFYGDHYVFTFEDSSWNVITEGSTLEELYKNIKEAMDLHYGKNTYDIDLKTPITFHITNDSYATYA